jgi:hypothetical protein
MRASGRAPIVTRSCPAPDQVQGSVLCRHLRPATRCRGNALKYEQSQRRGWPGHPRDEVPGDGHGESEDLLMSPRAQAQAPQLLFRKLARERSYVNENVSAGAKNLASTCLLDRNPLPVRSVFGADELIITSSKFKLVDDRILEFETLIKPHKYPPARPSTPADRGRSCPASRCA